MGLIKKASEILGGRPRPADDPAPHPGRPRSNRKCGQPGCDRKHHALNMCSRHHWIWWSWGDPQHVYVRAAGGWCGCPAHKGRPYSKVNGANPYPQHADEDC